MEKWLCWGAIGVGGLMLLLFILDLVLDIAGQSSLAPFGGLSSTVDVICVLAAGLLLYVSIDAMREMR